MFTAEPSDMYFCGSIENSTFHGYTGARSVDVDLSLLGRFTTLTLHGAVLELDAGRCYSGKIGGGLLPADYEGQFLRGLSGAFNAQIGLGTPEGACLRSTFDTNNDSVITIAELKDFALLNQPPDIDLFAGGVYDPGIDGENDAHSFGVPLDCVGADFAIP